MGIQSMALMFANKKQIRQETEQHTMNINTGSITITIITYGIATHAPTTTMANYYPNCDWVWSPHQQQWVWGC
jgi:hypothetical protein